jgi:hypothetical protein
LRNPPPRHDRAVRGVVLALLLGGCSWAARPQSVAQGVQSIDRQQAEQERLKKMLQGATKAYIDRVMVPGEVPDLSDDGSQPASALEQGFSAWSAETRAQASRSSEALQLKSSRALGQRVVYRRETINYGAYELVADVRKGRGITASFFPSSEDADDIGTRVSFRGVGLPITTQLYLDSAAGVIYSDVATGLGRTDRLSPPVRPLLGLSARLYTDASELRAGFGNRGELAGGPFASFERSEGRLAWLGASHRTGPFTVGLQVNRAQDVPDRDSQDGTSRTDIDSLAASVSYATRLFGPTSQDRLRVTYLRSRKDGQAAAQGLFVEGSHTDKGFAAVAGFYKADPALYFGDASAAVGDVGAYLRADWFTGRLSWGGGVAVERSGESLGTRSRYASVNAYATYRLDRRSTLGGTVHVQQSDTRFASAQEDASGRSYHVSVYHQTQPHLQGFNRYQLTLRRREQLTLGGAPASGEEFEWQRDWIAGSAEGDKPELVTSLGIAHDRSEGRSTLSPTAGLRFRYTTGEGWLLGGHLRYTSSRSNLSASRGLSGSLDAEKQITEHWRIGASVSLNESRVTTEPVPLGSPQLIRSKDRYVSLYVRWDDVAGTSMYDLGLGGGLSRGAGGLEGVVFFDADRDGARQVSETGAGGIEVLLDGRFRTTTDRSGRFVFPLVPTGPHIVSLQLNSVPLPWGVPEGRTWQADVPLRGTATLEIPLVRGSE